MSDDKEIKKERDRLWRIAHPEYSSKYSKDWRTRNKEKINGYDVGRREIQNKLKRELQKKYIATVLEHYGKVCVCCGETEPIFLTIDHTNGDGARHRMEINNNIYRWLVKNNFPDDGFRILCFNCNCGRSRNNGVCPHKI